MQYSWSEPQIMNLQDAICVSQNDFGRVYKLRQKVTDNSVGLILLQPWLLV